MTHMTLFLDPLPISTLETRHGDKMEAPISEEEVLLVIKNLRRGLPPARMVSQCRFVKCLRRFQLHTSHPFDKHLNSAFISVIPKPNKDRGEVENYRPISLNNNDMKILTKILANRMASSIGLYAHKDQVGFIPGRQGLDQIRRVIDIISLLQMEWDKGRHQEGLLLSTDLQKAFDSVSWPYLFDVMGHWGFGQRFMGLLSALYSFLEARVCLQGYYSEPIKIARGTRQGCPLSPLIFAIAIETLAIAIRTHQDIQGVSCGPQTHKCALFANNLLLFVTSPTTSLPNICALLADFAKASGLRVNLSKSQILNINSPTQDC